jgi:lipoprotein-anchoring transpeptidase ErfK/SrfK
MNATAKKLGILVFILVFGTMYFGTGLVFAGDSTTQIVTYSVNSINEISVTGAPTLTIIAPAAGSLLADAEDSTTTYAITTNGSGLKITGSQSVPAPVS